MWRHRARLPALNGAAGCLSHRYVSISSGGGRYESERRSHASIMYRIVGGPREAAALAPRPAASRLTEWSLIAYSHTRMCAERPCSACGSAAYWSVKVLPTVSAMPAAALR